MINKFHLKTIEDIAIQYITILQPTESNLEETINTVEDPKLSIKGATSIGGSFYCRTNKFFDNENYIFFRKIPQKNIYEDDSSFLNSETEESSSRVTIHNSSTVIKLTHTKIYVKNCKNLTYNKKLFFPLKYDIVYDCLSGLYIPLITNLEDLNNLRNYMNDTKNRIEYFSLHESIFSPEKKTPYHSSSTPLSKKIEEFLEEEKCCEIVEFCLVLFILHLIMGAKIKHTEYINDEDMEGIYGEACFVLDKLRENIMLKLLYNENYKNENDKNKNINDNNNNKSYSSNISFESVCSRYIKDYFKENKKTQKNIINNLNSNLEIIFQRLYTAINILLINFTKVKIYTNNVNDPDEVESYFLELLDYNFPQTDDELIPKEDEKKIKDEKKDKNKNNQINNNKEPTPLTKEFLDQYEVFKEMFYFLTHKEPRGYKKNKTLNNNEINNDIFIQAIKDKDKDKEKEEFISDIKIIDNKNKNKNVKTKKKEKNNLKHNSNKIKDNLTLELISEKSTEEINSSFYMKLKYYFNLYFNNFISLLERNKVKPPFLPKLDDKKYKYTLVLDLDETLVHYVEEENSAYVQVRPHADEFLKILSKHFELVLFTAAEEDYTGIVLNELNRNNYITHILCRKYTEFKNGCYIKDLSKLGRDLKRVCIVDNNKDNFSLQPENGLFISSYYGEQNDNELSFLCNDLMKIIEIQPDDIRTVLKQIDENMQKRYNENMYGEQ